MTPAAARAIAWALDLLAGAGVEPRAVRQHGASVAEIVFGPADLDRAVGVLGADRPRQDAEPSEEWPHWPAWRARCGPWLQLVAQPQDDEDDDK